MLSLVSMFCEELEYFFSHWRNKIMFARDNFNIKSIKIKRIQYLILAPLGIN